MIIGNIIISFVKCYNSIMNQLASSSAVIEEEILENENESVNILR